MNFKIFLLFVIYSFLGSGCSGDAVDIGYSELKPKVINLDLQAQDDGRGGLIAADVNDDGKKDFIITKPGYIIVYDNFGNKLWKKQINIWVTKKSETDGLPGLHGPGVQAADIDGDQKTEVLFLTQDNTVFILRGNSGDIKNKIKLESPSETERWEHLVIANFRGKGDRDLLLQATNRDGYRMGCHLAVYSIGDLIRNDNKIKPLWTKSDFIANAHNGVRVADLNGDGKDEVLGGMILNHKGQLLIEISLKGHIDSLFVADVRPDILGLEVVALEEGGGVQIFPENNRFFRLSNRLLNNIFGGGNHIYLYNSERLIWKGHYKNWEPQNAALGEFDLKQPGLEIWCRSRFNRHQKPFVFNAKGQQVSRYLMDDVAPFDWTIKGIEVIHTIDWTGKTKQLAVAKERHKSGDVCLFDPVNGEFLIRFREKADRLYVADVYGDWREEIIVLNGDKLHIYINKNQNPNSDHPKLWSQHHYRRNKMTWNYYSP